MSECLTGKTIKKVMLASDGKAMLFILENGGEVKVKADGDCCSSTWINSIELPAMGFPAKVISVSNLEMPDHVYDEDYDVIQHYGCKIATDKGDLVIDYRNESNGYYGGNLCWPGDYFYGGVYGQNISSENWRELTEDKV